MIPRLLTPGMVKKSRKRDLGLFLKGQKERKEQKTALKHPLESEEKSRKQPKTLYDLTITV